MLEIILLITLCRRIGEKALSKGQEKGRWQLYTVLAWIAFEIIGVTVGMLINPSNFILAGVFGLACGFGGYLLMKYRLDQIPDKNQDLENWMDRLGKEDNT